MHVFREENGLLSYRDTAESFGVSYVTISDLVRTHGLTPKPMSNGRAKGLDRSDRRVLRRALFPRTVRVAA